MDLIPGSGRSPEEGNGYPLQYSCLENPLDRGPWQAIQSIGSQSLTREKRLSAHAQLLYDVALVSAVTAKRMTSMYAYTPSPRLWRNWNSSGYLSTLNVYIAFQNYDQKICIIYSDLPFHSGIKFFLSALDQYCSVLINFHEACLNSFPLLSLSYAYFLFQINFIFFINSNLVHPLGFISHILAS